jgi:Dolichyl-phosphate-mannose-protein mannosyltransferase
MIETLSQEKRIGWTAKLALSQWRELAINAVLGICLLVLVLIPRLADIDALVTPDEPLWVARSANFYQALSSGHLKYTYQFVHPGVPVMWLGAIAYMITRPDLPELTGGQIGTRGSEAREILTANGDTMINVLVDLRIAVTIASALTLIVLFFCLIPLVGRWPALAAVAFLSIDPMHIGFTRLLHLDGLSTNLLLVSVVAFCGYMQRSSRPLLLISGVAAGVACLTRSANGVLGPLVAMLAAVDVALVWWRNRQFPRQLVRKYALAAVLWGSAAFLACFLLWPAMWVAPIDTFRAMWTGGIDLASDPHSRQLLFRGEVTTDDPGWLYYPIVLIYRISPLTLVGLGFALIVAIFNRGETRILPRRLCFNLVLFAGAYIVILSLAAKKLDRYVLPSIAALDLVAIFGWIALFHLLISKLTVPNRQLQQLAMPLLVGIVLLGQLTLAQSSSPYYLNEASALVGGPVRADEEISFGWGEGGKKVAEALLQIPDIDQKLVVAGPWPTTIDYYLPFTLTKPTYTPLAKAAAQWVDADYIVVTEPEVQRQLYSPELLAWFDEQTPVSVVMDQGRVYARIFDVSEVPLPSAFFSPKTLVIQWGDNLQQVAWRIPQKVAQGKDVRLHLYFQNTGGTTRFIVDTEISDADGNSVGQSSVEESLDAGNQGPVDIAYNVALPPDLIKGSKYQVKITLRDADTGQVLPSTHMVTGEVIESPVRIGSFQVK